MRVLDQDCEGRGMLPYPVFKVNFLTSPIKKGFAAAWAQSAGKASSWFYPGLDLARESVSNV